MEQFLGQVLSSTQYFMAECSDFSTREKVLQTIDEVCTHLLEQPLDNRFNVINMDDPNFLNTIGSFPTAITILETIGYVRIVNENQERFLAIEGPDPMKLAATKMAVEACLTANNNPSSLATMTEEAPQQAASSTYIPPQASSSTYVPPSRYNQPQSHMEQEENEDDNEDVCSYCFEGGDLLLCDTCPKAFHTHCVGLYDVPEGDWHCPLCLTPEEQKQQEQQKQELHFQSVTPKQEELAVEQLATLGFSLEVAQNAFLLCNKDSSKAADYLLQSRS